jgi:hypothetical protein
LTTTESIAPGANPAGTVQLIVCVPVQVHPPVEDEMLVTIRFAGTGSVTVTICVVGPAVDVPPPANTANPLLAIASVKVPVPGTATDLVSGVSDRVSDGGTITVAVAGVGVGHCEDVEHPPLFAVKVFVYGEPTPDVTV